jgi:hypothetical protein
LGLVLPWLAVFIAEDNHISFVPPISSFDCRTLIHDSLVLLHADLAACFPRLVAAKTMNTAGKAVYLQRAEEQSRLPDEGDSDSSSSPLVTKRSTAASMTQRGLPGSPRRNGMVLDVNVRSMFSRAARSPQSRGRSPGRYQRCGASPFILGIL